MKLAVIAANGKAGQLITAEAMKRGLDVTAIVRGSNRSPADKAIIKQIEDLTAEDLAEFDVVIDAFGTWTPDSFILHDRYTQKLADLLSGTTKRLLIVGAAGALYVDDAHLMRLVDTPDFPLDIKPLADAEVLAFDNLRKRQDVLWTYIVPAIEFQHTGTQTGKYQLGGERLLVNSAGVSILSYADYALAVIDEVIQGNHIQELMSVCSV